MNTSVVKYAWASVIVLQCSCLCIHAYKSVHICISMESGCPCIWSYVCACACVPKFMSLGKLGCLCAH